MTVRIRWAFAVTACAVAAAASAETWEQQAERLQHVSAALLDNMPMAEMPVGDRSVMAKANVSLLPKMNGQMGAKKENVPSSPVHAVPTLQGDWVVPVTSGWFSGARLWAGYLPSGSEKLVNLKASMVQSSYGAAWLNRFKFGAFEPGFELGWQGGSAKVSGAITATDAEDEFDVKTQILYGALGVRIPTYRLWGNVLVASRSADSEFYIPADATRLKLEDNNAPGIQVATGIDLAVGLQLGVAQLYIPKRLTMTRVLVGWKVSL